VEDDSARLAGAVAYINLDVTATGPLFSGDGSPSLRSTLRSVAATVPDPGGEGSIYEAWRRASRLAADSLEPSMGDPGGGSDFAGFYNHAGIPHLGWGFSGRYGVYHSQYDSYAWMTRFGDPDFKRQTAAGALAAAVLLRLANADVVPYDYAEYARNLRARLPALDSSFVAKGYSALNTAALRGALDRMQRAAERFGRARDATLAQGAPARRRLERSNAALRAVERILLRPSGLEGRPWYRNLVFASDPDDSYATLVFPGVQEAVRRGDRRDADQEIADLAGRIARSADALFAAADILTGDDRR
jgi:N-acetylated-alpha-linked acidic dipeptidase